MRASLETVIGRWDFISAAIRFGLRTRYALGYLGRH